MRAIVTGAAGFIGRYLVQHLASSGYMVTGFDILPGLAPHVIADVSVPGALDDLMREGEGVLFHLAANANVPLSVEEPVYDLRHTFEAAFWALESARTFRWQVILPSSAAVYDTANALPLREDALIRPSSPYGAAKTAVEAYASAYYRAFGVDVRVARLFNVYGEQMHQFVIHDVVRKLQRDPRRLELMGDGKQTRDYLYVADAVRALETIAVQGGSGETYNLASGVPVRVIDLARQISVILGADDCEIVTTGRSWPGDIQAWYADVSKLQSLGFHQSVGLQAGLERTVGWLLQNQHTGS